MVWQKTFSNGFARIVDSLDSLVFFFSKYSIVFQEFFQKMNYWTKNHLYSLERKLSNKLWFINRKVKSDMHTYNKMRPNENENVPSVTYVYGFHFLSWYRGGWLPGGVGRRLRRWRYAGGAIPKKRKAACATAARVHHPSSTYIHTYLVRLKGDRGSVV